MRGFRNLLSNAGAAVSSIALFVGISAIVLLRSGPFDPYLSVGAINPSVAALSPDDLKAGAATKLEQATAKGGSGYAFDVVQTSTIHAKPGGPLIDVPSPTNARQVIGQTDAFPFYTMLETGVVTPEGFWSELRAWPVNEPDPNFVKAELRRAALVRDGVAWRNDREGWYQTAVVPGIGLDPVTAALLPTLLRQSDDAAKQADELVDGATLLRVDAAGAKEDIPGVIAADGVGYTTLIAPVEFAFDGIGRITRIRVIALNTTMTDFDLVVDTLITIRYDDVGALPQPVPTWVPPTTTEETGR